MRIWIHLRYEIAERNANAKTNANPMRESDER
jgi:hypothetical protein